LVVTGSAGNDLLYGSRLNDVIEGLAGADRLVGGLDNDTLKGGPGNDILVGGPGVDAIGGGPGNDVIRARDGLADRIFCSGGTDVVVADAIDVTSGCERVLVP
jgi:Ca2+-binding RTX toxin-like protein